MNHVDAEVYGSIETGRSIGELAAALETDAISPQPASFVLRLRIAGERVEFERNGDGYILSRNNEGPGWESALRLLSEKLTGLGMKHSFEFMNGDKVMERLSHGRDDAAGDEEKP